MPDNQNPLENFLNQHQWTAEQRKACADYWEKSPGGDRMPWRKAFSIIGVRDIYNQAYRK